MGVSHLLCPILYTYDVFNNPKRSAKYFVDIPWVSIYYNLPASPFILENISDLLPYLYTFRWTFIRIPPGRFLNLEKGFFPNRKKPSIALKAILIPYYIYGNTSLGGVPYTPNY